MCLNDILQQKFGRQQTDSGTTDQQKALNGFEPTIYYPTNWRGSYEPYRAMFPTFQRYGGTTAVAPEYYQRNYTGIFPIKQQPQIEQEKPYNAARYS